LIVQTEEDLEWLHFIRDSELNSALEYFGSDPNIRILEIGSGTGYMLDRIGEKYDKPLGLEVDGSAYEFNDGRIKLYDGCTIPFSDHEFDVVFSSHVLEHVEGIEEFIEETARVLKPGGLSIHIMPTPTWRIMTSLMHYFAVAKMLFRMIKPVGRLSMAGVVNKRAKSDLIKFVLYAPLHGLEGNVLTENYYFSKTRWNELFNASSLTLKSSVGLGFVYWGRDIFRFYWPLGVRKFLASLIGSSSNVYVMSKKQE